MKIGIVDYGAGNLRSVEKALHYVGAEYVVCETPEALDACDGIILPGVGAFPDAVKALKDKGLFDYLKTKIGERPFLGICLGMQLLFEKGHEFCECEGLGLIDGEVCPIAFSEGLKIPHMGWNSLILNENDPLLDGAEGNYYYFVHSFEAITPSENVTAYTQYGKKIVAAVRKGNVWGMQFHPEKSGEMGLDIIRKFCFGGKDVD